jgi:hypothetical protein
MPDNRDPLLSPVPINSLRPTQITVGLIEVKAKRKAWDKLGKKKAEYLGHHMMPVVIGPKGRPYVIEHHHLARALHDVVAGRCRAQGRRLRQGDDAVQ